MIKLEWNDIIMQKRLCYSLTPCIVKHFKEDNKNWDFKERFNSNEWLINDILDNILRFHSDFTNSFDEKEDLQKWLEELLWLSKWSLDELFEYAWYCNDFKFKNI